MNVSEPLMKCRNYEKMSKQVIKLVRLEKHRKEPCDCPCGIRHRGGMTLQRALPQNVGNCRSDDKREARVERLHEHESSDAERSVGAVHSSDETLVMREERRNCRSQFEPARQLGTRMTSKVQAKSFDVTKREVYAAWLRVKANKGACGVDGESLEQFEGRLSKNLYKLWNRMCSGSYFPEAVRRVEIPKRDGSMRPLGIPTVYDRVAQEVVRARLERSLEPLFHADSYGYRPGKSAKDAVAVCRKRSWKFDWVLDVDIKKFFDTIDHQLLMRAVRKHCREKWMVLYIERWLKAPIVLPGGTKQQTQAGTPQGGVISPLLANLFLHYAFDRWMERQYPATKFARYADDVIIHCNSETEAKGVREALRQRLADCGLTLHPEKTKIVYCKDDGRRRNYPHVSYRFLGFTFQPRAAMRKDGKMFTSFLPAVSREAQKAFRQKLKSQQLRRCVTFTVGDVARQINPLLRGWFSYFRPFYPSALRWMYFYVDTQLLIWARNKFCWAYRRAARWLARLKAQQPKLFAHWALLSHFKD